MRLLLAALVLASAAWSQASIQILSDATQVLVGRSMSFRAVVRDAQGNPVPNGAVTWATNNVGIASIDASGTLTARSLGTVRVQARSGSLFSEAAIQTIPSRVEISPNRVSLEVGKRQSFLAAAYDANGAVIPGVAFSWSVLNYRLGTSQVARIDTTGTLTGVSEGGAMVLGTYNYGDVQTGLQRQWVVTAPVEISVPKAYELRRLWSRERNWKSSFEVRAKPTMLWPADDGTLFFNASLDGTANALVNFDYNAGTFKLTSPGGQNRFVLGSYTTEFRTHSITRSGQVLSYEDTNINGAQINYGTSTRVFNHISNNTPLLAGTEATSALFLTRNSYTDGGASLVRANFRFELNPVTYTGLFLGYDGRYTDILVNTSDQLPGITGAFTIDGDFGVDKRGAAVYSVTAGANRVFFRHTPGGSRTRLIGIGDALLGSTVRSFAGGRGNHPTFWLDEDGTTLLCVVLNNNTTHFVRWLPDGKLESLQVSGQSGVLWHHPLHGTLLHANPFNNRGNGIWLWPPTGDAKPLFRYANDKVDSETIQDVESGAINGRGEYFAYMRGERSNMMIVQLGLEQPRIVLRSGDTAEIKAPLNIINFIGGARTGAPHVYAGGSSGSIVEMSPDGPRAVMPYGERLWGNNTMWFGAFHGGTWNVRKSPTGDIYFTTGSGIARIAAGGGAPELVLRFPLRVGTLTINAPGTVDVNSRGDMLYTASTSAGDSRIFLHPQGAAEPKELLVYSGTATTATTLNNRVASGYDSFAFNDEGHVLISLRFRNVNVPILYVHDGANWKELAVPNSTRVGPHLITGIANLHRAGGGKLYAGLSMVSGTILCEWQTDRWEIVVNNTTVMPSGQVANSIGNQESNRNGDLLFQHNNGGTNLIVRRGDKMYQVLNQLRPTADGDYIQRINSIDFRDDGTVYFLAGTVDDDLVLYEARPIF